MNHYLKFWRLALSVAILGTTLVACQSGPIGERGPAAESESPRGSTLHLCGAIRGNGAKVFSTISSMASFTENYGTFDALSGASSGGIATFIYESALKNPLLHECGSVPKEKCDELARRRVGFMLKGFQGYIDYVGKDSPESSPFWVLKKFLADLKKKNVEALLLKGETIRAFFAVHQILENKDVRTLVNPDIADFVDLKKLVTHKQNLGGLKTKLERLVATAKEGVSLSRSDPELLVRTGLPNMPQIMRFVGRIGDFYAGYGPPMNKQGWRDLFNSCTDPIPNPTFRQPWTKLRGTQCGKDFKKLVKEFHDHIPARYQTRADDNVGTVIPILNSSSMLVGKENVDTWRHLKEVYDNGQNDWIFKPNFDRDFRLGYWGNPADLKFIEDRIKSWGDYKSQRFFNLGQAPWYVAMAQSASEPGLAHALPYKLPSGEEVLTTGGWADSQSVLVLKTLGCEHVVYVTRRGADSDFAKGVARSLQMPEGDVEKLFGVRVDATEPYSSHELSIMQASGVWCTDWNKAPLDPDKLGDDGHAAPLQTNPELGPGHPAGYSWFQDRKIFPDPYPAANAHTGLQGCEVRRPSTHR